MKGRCRFAFDLWLFATICLLSVVPAETQQTYRLTLEDAIRRALAANINGQLANERVSAADAVRQRRQSAAFFPHLDGQVYANYQNRNLRAFGLTFPGIPGVIGPFSNYDASFYGQQSIVDLASYHTLKASERDLEADRLDAQDARELIIRSVAEQYLAAESAAARAAAAQSRITDSIALLKLATDKHDAGTATGVDVLRAQVQLANDKQGLLIAQTQFKQSLLALARAIGISPSTPLELADALQFQPLAHRQPEELARAAIASRADYQSLASQRQSIQEQLNANRARWYPKLSLSGSYGAIGRSVGGMQGTGVLQGQIDIPLYDRDRDGESQQLASNLRAMDDRIADLGRGIEEEVREALLGLDSAAEQVDVASQGQHLAQRELELAQDRFAQGTANNVEVITAQDELARAQENYILAISSHVDAKFALARALGQSENNLSEPALSH